MINPNDAKILIVDDEPLVGELLSRWLIAGGHPCVVVQSGDEALKMMEYETFDLMISDIMMPGMTGIELLTQTRQLYPEMAVVMVTAVDDRTTALGAVEQGAFGYVIKPFEKNEIFITVANALERRRLLLISQEYERTLEAEVRERTREIRERERETILRLISASGYRDDETGAHILRIGLYAAVMGEYFGWSEDQVYDMRLAGAMHDVGKIGIPDGILLKPGKLTVEEFSFMKTHTIIGASILDSSDVPLIKLAREIALAHHEKWNGSGYPQGLAGKTIPESARIVAVVDVYDALSHDRVYRAALPENEVLTMMEEGKGSHFDPDVFDAFLHLLPQMRRIRERIQEDNEVDPKSLKTQPLERSLGQLGTFGWNTAILEAAWRDVTQ